MKISVLAATLAMTLLLTPRLRAAEEAPKPASTPADACLGSWYTEEQKSKIEIVKKDGKFEGKITWLKAPKYTEEDAEGELGVVKHDRKNPDAAKRATPLLGLQILQGFTYAGESRWENGTVYDPESGKTYKCKMWLDGNDKLKVKGYVGVSVLGRTTLWTRAEDKSEKK